MTALFGAKDTPPVEMLRQWLLESYRAVAPKKLAALLDSGAPVSAPIAVKKNTAKKAPAKKAAETKAPAKKKVASSRTRRA